MVPLHECRATCVEVGRGYQKYTTDRTGPGKVIFLWGWNQASGVKVGDTGTMEFRVSASYGLWFFVKDKEAK